MVSGVWGNETVKLYGGMNKKTGTMVYNTRFFSFFFPTKSIIKNFIAVEKQMNRLNER